MADLVCWNCGASLAEIPRPISRHANCPKCYEVVHCCRMCRFYKPGRPGDCDHERAEPPVEKENANFCDYFSPTSGAFASSDGERKDEAKSRFASLFGADDGEDEGDDEAEGSDPRTKLDGLFDD